MTQRNLNYWIGRAAMACLLFVPGLAHASCLTTRPSFTSATVAQAGGYFTVSMLAPAGCSWELVSGPAWIQIVSVNHGVGPGSVTFLVLANPAKTTRRGSLSSPAVCEDPNSNLGGRSSLDCSSAFAIEIDQQ